MLADKILRTSPEAFRNRLKNYPNWEKPSQVGLAVKFLEERRQRLAQMTEMDIQDLNYCPILISVIKFLPVKIGCMAC